MFPFRWDILPKGFLPEDIKENIAFDERTDLLNGIPDAFGNWKRWKYTLDSGNGTIDPTQYNEFIYFHEFVSKAIFDYDFPFKNNQAITKYYEYDLDKNLQNKYIIEYLDKNQAYELELDLEGITMHFFNTGVGVLTFNLINNKDSQKEKEHILKINEFGRRIYPQFMGEKGIADTKNTFLANKITVIANSKIVAVEDFNWYELHKNNLNPIEPYRLPAYITDLFSEYFIFRIPSPLKEQKILITKVCDDRMFFQSWYGNRDIATEMSYLFKRNQNINNDWWYSFIFGDKNEPSIANSLMKVAQQEEHSYKRWIEWKTVYGMSRDSFVSLTDSGDFSKLIQTHMNTMYYTLCVLCLAQRASVLKFTAEVANLADLAKMQENKKVINNIKDLYKNYIEFINKLYFREITPQIQGIEMYNQFQKILNLKEEIKDLDNEINELHSYVSLVQDGIRNEESSRLNILAAIFLPATIAFGILGANFWDEKFFDGMHWAYWTLIGLLPSVIALVFYLFTKNKNI